MYKNIFSERNENILKEPIKPEISSLVCWFITLLCNSETVNSIDLDMLTLLVKLLLFSLKEKKSSTHTVCIYLNISSLHNLLCLIHFKTLGLVATAGHK